jgi:hypothetical protein
MKLILMLIFLLAAIGQNSKCENDVSLDRELTVKYGQTTELKEEKLKIKFVSVPEDSRCPQGEQCIRAGNGSIMIEVTGANSQTTSFTLNTNDEPREVVYRGYGISLIDLQPYPKSGVEIKPVDYAAIIKVYKAG